MIPNLGGEKTGASKSSRTVPLPGGAALNGLITLTFCWKESFILTVINLLKFKTGSLIKILPK